MLQDRSARLKSTLISAVAPASYGLTLPDRNRPAPDPSGDRRARAHHPYWVLVLGGTMTRKLIRQAPGVAEKLPPGEFCPRHGYYERDPEVGKLRAKAWARDTGVRESRALLDESSRLLRYCPHCRGQRPGDMQYATEIRLMAA